MNNTFEQILNDNIGKKVIIVTHGTAMMYLLKKWCDLVLDTNTNLVTYKYNNKDIFNGKWNYLETFKLEFNEKELISLENLKIKDN